MSAEYSSPRLRPVDYVAAALLLLAAVLYALMVNQGDQCFNHRNCRPGEALSLYVLALVSGLAGVGTLGFNGRPHVAQVTLAAWAFVAVVPALLFSLNDILKRLG